MTSLFGELRVRVDSWEVDYGDQTPLAPDTGESTENVNLDVEVGDGSWQPITPAADALRYQRAVFIDGVRRLEARIQAREGEQLVYGGFGSFAVGAVNLEGATASFGDVRVSHLVVLGSGRSLPSAVRVYRDLVYEPESTLGMEIDAPLRHIQRKMRLAEATLAQDLCRDDTLIIVDGPLSFEPVRPGIALGYIKRVHELYLPPRFLPLLATLPAAARTPLFGLVSAKSGFARYSWYQRLAQPSLGATELHGIVRLEVSANLGINAARQLADAATTWLPRTAPQRARDPRSPQNLLPIGALEQRLRGALGDGRLHRRWIETLVAQEAARD